MSARRAISIVEMLVVMGVVSALAGVSLVAMSGVQKSSRSIQCQVNLRQMAIAAHSYAALYNAFPPSVRYENEGTFLVVAWDWVQTMQEEVVAPGPLWAFTDDPQAVQQCPEYQGPSNFGADPFTGYNYNASFIGGHGPFPSTNWQHFQSGVAPHRCNRAAACAMFGDGGWKGGANKFMRSPLDPHGLGLPAIYSGGQAFRHNHQTNVAYVDCHVDGANKPHRGMHATDDLLAQFLGYPANGFLSDDDRAYDPR